MFYRPADGHGLPHNPLTAIISPRPIAWVSTTGALGDNLAPYSFFNAVAYTPPQIMFASTGIKDSVTNIRETGVFCVNILGRDLMGAMNETSAPLPRDVDEFAHAGVAKAACSTIACPRVGDAPAALECRLTQIVTLRGTDNLMVLGEVTGVHLRDDCLTDGRFDARIYHPVARMGYRDYAIVTEPFELLRPDERG